jgi:integrase
MKVPSKKNPLGRGVIPGHTLVRVGSEAKGVLRGTDGVGRPLWEYVVRAQGGKPSKNLYCRGWDDATSEARKQVARWQAEAQAAPVDAKWTMAETIRGYLEYQADRNKANPGTQRAEAAWIRRVVEPHFVDGPLKGMTVDRITEDHVRAWKAKYVEDGRSKSTQHHRVRVLDALLRFAIASGQRLTNPVKRFRITPASVKKSGDQRVHYPLSAVEMMVLQDWLDANTPPPVAFAIRLAAAVGCRDQELTHLRLEDDVLDAVTPLVHIAHFKCACRYCKTHRGGQRRTKTSHERLVVLPPELVTPFRDYLAARDEQVPAASAWAFPVWSAIRSGRRRPGDQLGESVLNDHLQRAVKAVKLAVDRERQRLVFHSLRAFAHTELTDRSHDYEAVAVQLGHALPGMGNRYSTLAEQPAKLAAALYPKAKERGDLALSA